MDSMATRWHRCASRRRVCSSPPHDRAGGPHATHNRAHDVEAQSGRTGEPRTVTPHQLNGPARPSTQASTLDPGRRHEAREWWPDEDADGRWEDRRQSVPGEEPPVPGPLARAGTPRRSVFAAHPDARAWRARVCAARETRTRRWRRSLCHDRHGRAGRHDTPSGLRGYP